MKKKSIVYDPEHHSTLQLAEYDEQGIEILCHKCKSKLIIALDEESASKHGVHPGIYCPNKHVCITVELESTRQRFLDWMERLKEKDRE